MTRTDSRPTTEMILGELTDLVMSENRNPQEAFNLIEGYLTQEEMEEYRVGGDRWFSIERDEEGNEYATTGTTDLDGYILIEK